MGEAGPAMASSRAGFGDVSADQERLRQQAGHQSCQDPSACGEPLRREAGTFGLVPPKLLPEQPGSSDLLQPPLSWQGHMFGLIHFPFLGRAWGL